MTDGEGVPYDDPTEDLDHPGLPPARSGLGPGAVLEGSEPAFDDRPTLIPTFGLSSVTELVADHRPPTAHPLRLPSSEVPRGGYAASPRRSRPPSSSWGPRVQPQDSGALVDFGYLATSPKAPPGYLPETNGVRAITTGQTSTPYGRLSEGTAITSIAGGRDGARARAWGEFNLPSLTIHISMPYIRDSVGALCHGAPGAARASLLQVRLHVVATPLAGSHVSSMQVQAVGPPLGSGSPLRRPARSGGIPRTPPGGGVGPGPKVRGETSPGVRVGPAATSRPTKRCRSARGRSPRGIAARRSPTRG